VVLGSFRLESTAGAPDADLPSRSQLVHELEPPASPDKERRLGKPSLAPDFANRGALIRLTQNESQLRLAELRPLDGRFTVHGARRKTREL